MNDLPATPMRALLLFAGLTFAAASLRAQPAPSVGGPTVILFVGNSFTYGGSTAVRPYDAAEVTDEKPGETGVGGIPAIFKKLADEAGLRYEVHVEVVGGKDLAFHYEHAQSLLADGKWDVVVLQGYSTEPLPSTRGGKPDSFLRHADLLKKIILAGRPTAKVYLYETWAYPFKAYSEDASDPARALAEMAGDLRTGYHDAAAALGSPVVPVGDAWMQAIQSGVATADAFHPAKPGEVMLWDNDHKHPSVEGSYLAALVLCEAITGADVRKLGASEQAARDLRIPPEAAVKLQSIAAAMPAAK